ncbi:hypothetical protein IE53DRAFT_384758 [Violaceomyces palustris]|uniref:Uncharacterized protein n=1 Tax=Violaceomyces palustris TaxID=1673888 RepID=A0ACD0P3V1_9BASI|nr:hypothetical protein IE53DRAFT_384758 [Violaceomyces palustris]
MSSTRKQRIRPRFVDLAEFDDLEGEPQRYSQRAAPSSSSNPASSASASSSSTNAFDWPSAAHVVRKPPPTIASSKQKPKNTDGTAATTASTPPPSTLPSHQQPPEGESSDSTEGTGPQASQPSRQKVVRIAPSDQNQIHLLDTTGPSSLVSPDLSLPRKSPSTSDTGFSFGPSSQPQRDDHLPNRFPIDLDGEPEDESFGARGGPNALAALSLIGSVSERPRSKPGPSSSQLKQKSSGSGSRFMASRQMDQALKQAQGKPSVSSASDADGGQSRYRKTLEFQERGTGFPAVHRRDTIDPILPPLVKSRNANLNEDISSVGPPTTDSSILDDEEEWLDEDGKPMSAFRKARLIRQGLGPPSRRRAGGPSPSSRSSPVVAGHTIDPTRDPGGGADPESIEAMLASVSAENEAKIRGMSKNEVEDELQSLESLFGPSVLDALRKRKVESSNQSSIDERRDEPSSQSKRSTGDSSTGPSRKWEAGARDAGAASASREKDPEGPLAIKRRYFPAEPEGINPSLEWMMPEDPYSSDHPPLSTKPGFRFDFEGRIIRPESISTDLTYISGLHHHGEDQGSPGYTVSELLHLVKSTVASQRSLAIKVLSRICQRYPSPPSKVEAQGGEDKDVVEHLDSGDFDLRAQIILSARWLLEDRNFSVRSAALGCLVAGIVSGPTGCVGVLGVERETSWLSHASKKTQNRGNDSLGDHSSYKVLIQNDWAETLVRTGILTLFCKEVRNLVSSEKDQDSILEILLLIASRSSKMARKISKEEGMFDLIIKLGVKRHWPPVKGEMGLSSAWPSLTSVELLLVLIMGSKEDAIKLVTSGSVDSLMRFVMLLPWTLEKDADEAVGEDVEIATRSWQLLSTTMRIYSCLAKYGLYASVVGRTWKLWKEIGDHFERQMESISNAPRSDLVQAKLESVKRYFDMLQDWTACAIDPHLLQGVHDVTWSQVRNWIDLSCDLMDKVESFSTERCDPSIVSFVGAMYGHMDAWLTCASGKEPALLGANLRRIIKSSGKGATFLRLTCGGLQDKVKACSIEELSQIYGAFSNLLHLRTTLLKITGELEIDLFSPPFVETFGAIQEILELAERLAWGLLASDVWEKVESFASRLQGRHSHRMTLIEFCRQALNLDANISKRSNSLALLRVLGPAESKLALKIVLEANEKFSKEDLDHKCLEPFLYECVVGGYKALPPSNLTRKVSSPPLRSSVESILRTKTLFYSDGRSCSAEWKGQEAKEEEKEKAAEEDLVETDPVTGSPLWKCPASGLPIRKDWPLLPLDDLLKSANASVFNRANNLPDEWNPNEQDIVASSLLLCVSIFTELLSEIGECQGGGQGALSERAQALGRCLPTKEEIWLGLMKVFMLEKDQAETNEKASGRITGRDLYRLPVVSGLISKLFDISDRIHSIESRKGDAGSGRGDLEEAFKKTFGEEVPFFQFYCDLIGLYDSTSFGDKMFSKVLTPVLSYSYPKDYRNLFWKDYQTSLRSIGLKLFDLPKAGANRRNAYFTPFEKGRELLERYCWSLRNSEITKGRNELVYLVALGHVCQYLWCEGEDQDGTGVDEEVKRDLAKILFGGKQSMVAGFQTDDDQGQGGEGEGVGLLRDVLTLNLGVLLEREKQQEQEQGEEAMKNVEAVERMFGVDEELVEQRLKIVRRLLE